MLAYSISVSDIEMGFLSSLKNILRNLFIFFKGPTENLKMNSTLLNTSVKCIRDTSVTSVVFPGLYSILCVVALVLNSLAAVIFFSIPSTTTFVVFLKNVVSSYFRP